jgi:hypothetical protein
MMIPFIEITTVDNFLINSDVSEVNDTNISYGFVNLMQDLQLSAS